MIRLKNIILALLGFSPAMAACNDNDVVTNVNPEVKTGDVRIYATTTTLTRDLTVDYVDFSDKDNLAPTAITLNPAEKYQTMDGFGAAVTGATCYNLLLMAPEDRKKFLVETFSDKDGFGFSYIRISIGCSDFSLGEYTCCDEAGIENFALQSDETKYVIPVLKEILEINPSIKIIGTPWTCPLWMKVDNLTNLKPYSSWTGGHLNPAYYQDYATYFVKWIQAFQAEGINIYAITPQNEPLNAGNSASLYMSWEEQRDFVKTALGPKFKQEGIAAKIYVYDHNYDYSGIEEEKEYPCKIYEDAEASQYISGAAFHDYGGTKDELLNVHSAYPEKDLLFSETSIGTWNSGRDLTKRLLEDMKTIALGTVNNWCKGVLVWNLMLDNDRGPNREGGCQTCYGAVDINNSDYKTIIRNSHYYIIAHLSSVVKPDATRIGTSDLGDSNVIYSAFENTDGTYALVLMNNNESPKRITINDGKRHFAYDVPGKSVTSYRWAKSE